MGNTGVEHPTFTLKRQPILDVLNTLFKEKSTFVFTLPFEKRKISLNVIH